MYKQLGFLLLSTTLLLAAETDIVLPDDTLLLEEGYQDEAVDIILPTKGAPQIVKLNSISVGELPAEHIALSADGSLINATSNRTTTNIWLVSNGRLITSLSLQSFGRAAFDAQNANLGIPSMPATLLNIATHNQKTLPCPQDVFSRIIFFQNNKMLAWCPSYQGNDFLLWNASDQTNITRFSAAFNATSAHTTASSDGFLFAVYNNKEQICLFNRSTNKMVTIVLSSPYPYNTSLSLFTFSNNSPVLITGQDKVISVWNVDGQQIAVITLNSSGTGAIVTPTGFKLSPGQNPIALPVTIGNATRLAVIDPNNNWQPIALLNFMDKATTARPSFPAHISANGRILATSTVNAPTVSNRIDLWEIISKSVDN